MAWTSPTALITQFRTQVLACAVWTYGSGQIHYPDLTNLAGVTFPALVLFEDERRVVPFCEGASPLISGRLGAILMSTADVGTTEDLAQTLLFQLVQQQTGIPFNTAECGLSSDPSPGKVAGGLAVRTSTLHLPYGLNP